MGMTGHLALIPTVTISPLQILEAQFEYFVKRYEALGEMQGAPKAWLETIPSALRQKLWVEEEKRLLSEIRKLIGVFLRDVLKPMPLVLEVGCGTGNLAVDLPHSMLQYTGFDFNSAALRVCKRKLMDKGFLSASERLYWGSATHLIKVLLPSALNISTPFPLLPPQQPGTQDLIIWGRLDHRLLDNWKRAVGQSKQVLARSGIFLLYGPLADENPMLAGESDSSRTLMYFHEYESVFGRSMKLLTRYTIDYCEQVYTISAWQKLR